MEKKSNDKILVFHYFYWITCIFRVIFSLSNVVLLRSGYYEPADKELFYLCARVEYFDFVDIVSTWLIIAVCFNIIIFIMFKVKKNIGWYTVMLYWAYVIIHSLYNYQYCNVSMQSYASMIGYIVPTTMIELLIPLIFHSIAGVYYLKNKRLFFSQEIDENGTVDTTQDELPLGTKTVQEDANSLNHETEDKNERTVSSIIPKELRLDVPNEETKREEKLFCRRCGKEIPNDSDFCTGCGTKVIR